MNENDTSSDELQYSWVHVISLEECKERGVQATETNLCTYDKILLKNGTYEGVPHASGLSYGLGNLKKNDYWLLVNH